MSLRTCPQGHETCWPSACPVCRAHRPIMPRGAKPTPPAKGRKPLLLTAEGRTRTIAQWSMVLGYTKTHIRDMTEVCGDFETVARILRSRRPHP